MKLAQSDTDSRLETVELVNDACHEVNSALSTIALCVDFVAEQSEAEADEAVKDVRSAVRRIALVMATLRDTLEPEDSKRKRSAVFGRSDPPLTDGARTPSQPA
jgi:hypothetical protein